MKIYVPSNRRTRKTRYFEALQKKFPGEDIQIVGKYAFVGHRILQLPTKKPKRGNDKHIFKFITPKMTPEYFKFR